MPDQRPRCCTAKYSKMPDLPSPRVLLTGFEPFGAGPSALVNPSWLAVQTLGGASIAGHQVISAQLPTVFAQAGDELERLVKQHRPALVIGVGLAGGRQAISIERIAINLADARIADNCGAQPVNQAVVPSGPAAYFSTLPIKAMLAELQREGIDAEISHTAGTFVCNYAFYRLMHLLEAMAQDEPSRRVRGGFIHVPYLPEQGSPCMELEIIVGALRIALECALCTNEDAVLAGGTLH